MKMQDLIRRVIEIGCRSGFVTFDQINELMTQPRLNRKISKCLLRL